MDSKEIMSCTEFNFMHLFKWDDEKKFEILYKFINNHCDETQFKLFLAETVKMTITGDVTMTNEEFIAKIAELNAKIAKLDKDNTPRVKFEFENETQWSRALMQERYDFEDAMRRSVLKEYEKSLKKDKLKV